MGHIVTQVNDAIGTITLCRSDKMNAFDNQFVTEVVRAFEVLLAEGVRVVILRAQQGVKVWSAGLDIDTLPTGPDDMDNWQTGSSVLGCTIREFPIPIIALVEGSVWGFGCEVVFSCDLIVAVPESTFTITPAKLGAPYPITGICTFVNRLGSNIAKEMLFCATPFDAQRLYAQGIINHVVSPDTIEEYVYDLGKKISRLAPLSLTALKQQILGITRTSSTSPGMTADSELKAAKLFGSIDFHEGISALKSKRRPRFQGQ